MKKLFASMLILFFILTACTSPSPSTPPAQPPSTKLSESITVPVETATKVEPTPETVIAKPKEITIGLGPEKYPRRGWTIETDDAYSLFYIGVMETLIKVDYDGSMVPGLAESWLQVNDTTWQFNLRKGVSFTNGEPFNADAVVKALNYIKNSPTPPRGITAKTFEKIEAADEYTVLIYTSAFDALVPNRLTSPNTGILAPSAYIAESGPINPFNTGTGPFILTEEVPDQSLTLVKNPNYWGGDVKIDKATILLIPDPQIRAGMLQTGEIDMGINLPIEQLPVLEQNPDISILRLQAPRTTTLHLNMSRPPFNELKIRQAVAYALDKQAIVDATLEGAGTSAIGPISPSEPWFNPDLKGYPFDPEKAKQLLAEAGYEEGELKVSLWTYSARANLPLTALAIQDMLADIGIVVEIRIAQYDSLEPDVLSGNYDMFIISRSHLLDVLDVGGFFASDYSCDGSFNMAHFCDETFDSLLAQARSLTDIEARYDIYRKLQTILVDQQCAGVFLNYTDVLNGVRSNVLNFKNHPLERYILTADLDVTE